MALIGALTLCPLIAKSGHNDILETDAERGSHATGTNRGIQHNFGARIMA